MRDRTGSDGMVERYWNLDYDPFDGGDGPYLALPGHDEAVARLIHAITAPARLAILRAPGGLGKSRVLARALARANHPRRRIAQVRHPIAGPSWLWALAEGLGAVVPSATPGPAEAWKTLAQAIRLCRLQGLGVVLAVDDIHQLTQATDQRDLARLIHIDPSPQARLTVILVGRPDDPGSSEGGASELPFGSTIPLPALTRGESETYLNAKLAAASRTEPPWTRRALTILHACAQGIPCRLNLLAGLALHAGAARGVTRITPELIEAVAANLAASAAVGA